MYQAEWKG